MRYRAKNYSCRGEKCAQYPQLSVAASQSLKEEVVKHTDALQVSISSWIRKLIEDELRRKNNAR
tara:strand:- start:650 stop:841 length:192 start_codon:yes stop_codon:yes gene_type:complete